ncbi:uncharacterized protein LAJ45_02680 [Morchella importuna]|uniref:uncharacterized protein n=1 Tax=Morchella importuna TaxID=1174673 RepID=UPI001E8CD085|nr:uncharacterized protein LAJ45_02680 [Morchella importuna]KAH8153093.1 hypothetical protein LAJ45_02680 [Morchella importuna]
MRRVTIHDSRAKNQQRGSRLLLLSRHSPLQLQRFSSPPSTLEVSPQRTHFGPDPGPVPYEYPRLAGGRITK